MNILTLLIALRIFSNPFNLRFIIIGSDADGRFSFLICERVGKDNVQIPIFVSDYRPTKKEIVEYARKILGSVLVYGGKVSGVVDNLSGDLLKAGSTKDQPFLTEEMVNKVVLFLQTVDCWEVKTYEDQWKKGLAA